MRIYYFLFIMSSFIKDRRQEQRDFGLRIITFVLHMWGLCGVNGVYVGSNPNYKLILSFLNLSLAFETTVADVCYSSSLLQAVS